MCNTISELLSLQIPLASQKKSCLPFSSVYSLISKDPAWYLYACAKQMQTNLTRYWWQPQSANSNFHIPSMLAWVPNSTFTSWPDCGNCHVSSRALVWELHVDLCCMGGSSPCCQIMSIGCGMHVVVLWGVQFMQIYTGRCVWCKLCNVWYCFILCLTIHGRFISHWLIDTLSWRMTSPHSHTDNYWQWLIIVWKYQQFVYTTDNHNFMMCFFLCKTHNFVTGTSTVMQTRAQMGTTHIRICTVCPPVPVRGGTTPEVVPPGTRMFPTAETNVVPPRTRTGGQWSWWAELIVANR